MYLTTLKPIYVKGYVWYFYQIVFSVKDGYLLQTEYKTSKTQKHSVKYMQEVYTINAENNIDYHRLFVIVLRLHIDLFDRCTCRISLLLSEIIF